MAVHSAASQENISDHKPVFLWLKELVDSLMAEYGWCLCVAIARLIARIKDKTLQLPVILFSFE